MRKTTKKKIAPIVITAAVVLYEAVRQRGSAGPS